MKKRPSRSLRPTQRVSRLNLARSICRSPGELAEVIAAKQEKMLVFTQTPLRPMPSALLRASASSSTALW